MSIQRQFEIRHADNGDAAAILACLAAAFEPYRAMYTPDGFRDTVLTPETLRARMQTMKIFVAVSSGEIIGTIGYSVVAAATGEMSAGSASGKEGHVRGMAVAPLWQGGGAAAALLAAAEQELRACGCSRVTLDTTEPLKRAIRFYVKKGYTASGKEGDFFGMPLYEYVKKL